jgi:hypothetical protein
MGQQAVAASSKNTSTGVRSTMKGTSQFKQFWYEWFHEGFIDLFCKGWRALKLRVLRFSGWTSFNIRCQYLEVWFQGGTNLSTSS